MNNYEDIRPLTDWEVQKEIPRIFKSKIFREGFRFYIKKIAPSMNKKEFDETINEFVNAESVKDVQWAAYRIIEKNIQDKTDGIIVRGLDKLDKKNKYNFISTHINILGDPYYFGHTIMKEGFAGPVLGIGLNLTPIKTLKNLMKGQGCFIVSRENNGGKAFRNNSVILSNLIYDLYLHNNKSTWIPNRQGRAKDNDHTTQKSIITMMNYAFQEKKMDVSDMINLYNIVPVIISYEYVPTSFDFAYESENGLKKIAPKFSKFFNDAKTGYKGLARDNGRIKIIFGEPIKEDFKTSKEVALAIDEFILKEFPIWNTNKIAYGLKYYKDYEVTSEKEYLFVHELNKLENPEWKKVIDFYSKPIEKKITLGINPF